MHMQQGTVCKLLVSLLPVALFVHNRNPKRAIEGRIGVLKREFHLAIARANASGFNAETMGPLLCFADCFGAERLRYVQEQSKQALAVDWRSLQNAIASSHGVQ